MEDIKLIVSIILAPVYAVATILLLPAMAFNWLVVLWKLSHKKIQQLDTPSEARHS